MSELSKLSNIGDALEKRLNDVGIHNSHQLFKSGSKAAFVRLHQIDETACFSMLCALEGAIRGIRWHSLPDEIKSDLKLFHKTLSNK